MTLQARMRHRCTIVRGTRATYDTAADNTPHLSELACLYIAVTATEVTRPGGVRLGTAARLLVPLGTDIAPADRVTAITDGASGASLIEHPRAIDGEPIHRHNHLELILSGAS